MSYYLFVAKIEIISESRKNFDRYLRNRVFRFCVNLGGEQMLQSLTIYLTINTLINKLKL
jgi:hypothetical protein